MLAHVCVANKQVFGFLGKYNMSVKRDEFSIYIFEFEFWDGRKGNGKDVTGVTADHRHDVERV